jgi:NADH-quinone oxidoreductase subunit I
MTTTKQYFKNVWDGLATTLVGMKITGKYLLQKPITVQYPDERLPIPDRYRGIHYLEQEKCIDCLACARACPIDCIEMEAVRHGKELEWVSFTLDYQKCMFCELCVYPCPKDCIHMGTEFAFVTFDRSELKHDLLSFKGMAKEARIRMKEDEEKKKAKEAAKAAAKAKGDAAPKGAPSDAAAKVSKSEASSSDATRAAGGTAAAPDGNAANADAPHGSAPDADAPRGSAPDADAHGEHA